MSGQASLVEVLVVLECVDHQLAKDLTSLLRDNFFLDILSVSAVLSLHSNQVLVQLLELYLGIELSQIFRVGSSEAKNGLPALIDNIDSDNHSSGKWYFDSIEVKLNFSIHLLQKVSKNCDFTARSFQGFSQNKLGRDTLSV
jgi:hypothetical protein